MQFVQQKNLGYNRENVMEIPMKSNITDSRHIVKNDLLQLPGVLGVTFGSQTIQNAQTASGWKDSLMLTFIDVDKDFIPTMQMELAQGSNFSGSPADSAYFILNETAVKDIGMTDPIGKPFDFGGMQGTIIGVVKDFNFKDLHIKIEPMIFVYGFYAGHGATWGSGLMYVRLASGNVQHTVSEIEKIINRYNPDTAFNFTFLDDAFERLYRSDIRTGKLFNIFAIIAVLISCLGLFGLVTFAVETKTKEIGIRKVLGASVGNIVYLLSNEFLVLVGIAMLIAFPLAYYLLNRMLLDFAFRINIDAWIFVFAGIITLVLTIITVGFQAIRAATANPIKAIKSE
jgi:ABC-type antimicrobial peptide transport system permease subunit